MADIFKKGFNLKKFESERMGVGRGKMQWTNLKDIGWYYGISADPDDLRQGRMSKRLYLALCHTYGREQMEEYFTDASQRKLHKAKPDFNKEVQGDAEIDALAAII